MKAKILTPPIAISNHYELPTATRKVVAWVNANDDSRRMVLVVATIDNNGQWLKPYTEKYMVQALGEKDQPQGFLGPRRNPTTGAYVYKYEQQPASVIKFLGNAQIEFTAGGWEVDEKNKPVPNPDWDTSVSEANFLYDMTIDQKKQFQGITDASTDLEVHVAFMKQVIESLDTVGKRFAIKGDRVDNVAKLGLSETEIQNILA